MGVGLIPGRATMTPASNAQIAMRAPRRATRRARSSSATGSVRRRKQGAKRAAAGRKMKFGSPAWQKKYKVGRFAKKRR